MNDIAFAFVVGVSVGQAISLLLVIGAIKIGEVRAQIKALSDFTIRNKKRRISKLK
jgi:hypothetical protein